MTSGIINSKRQSEIQTRLLLIKFIEKDEENLFKTVFAQEQIYTTTLYHIKDGQNGLSFDDYVILAENEPLKESSKLAKLNSSINSQGLIQMNSRPDHHIIYPEQISTQIVLSNEQVVTEHIVLQIHRESSHIGSEVFLREVKLRYWVTGGRREIRRRLKLRR